MEIATDRTSRFLRGPGGKACTNCVRMKSKCTTHLDGSGCERCHRLNKSCIPSSPARRRGPKRNNTSRSEPIPTRIEKKLDDLMSLMMVQRNPADFTTAPALVDGASYSDEYVHESSPALTNSTSTGTGLLANSNASEPSIGEADSYLRRFREEMVPMCPFVHIPLDLDALALRQQYPFLWLNIMSVASNSAETRHALGDQIRKAIVNNIVAGGARSVDMLLGVLTFLCWAHLFPMDKLFISMASQIVVCLIQDIGLHLPPPEQPSKVGQLLKNKTFMVLPQIRKERTMEDRRALLGAYVITSMTCHAFRSADGLQWSSYLEDCSKYIACNSNESQDRILVAQVKLQFIVNQLRSTYRTRASLQISVIYIDALRSQLESLRKPTTGFGDVFENNSMMNRLYHFTMLMIYESLIINPSLSGDQTLERFQVYHQAVDSIRAWLDLYFSIQPQDLRFLPSGNYSQLYYVTALIYKITAFRIPAWDMLLAESGVELVPTLEKIIQKFEDASSCLPDCNAGEAFAFGILKFRALKAVWQTEPSFALNQEDNVPLLPDNGLADLSAVDFSSFLGDSAMFPSLPGIFDDLA